MSFRPQGEILCLQYVTQERFLASLEMTSCWDFFTSSSILLRDIQKDANPARVLFLQGIIKRNILIAVSVEVNTIDIVNPC